MKKIPRPTQADVAREAAIRAAERRALTAETREEKRAAVHDMAELIKGRSAAQIARMERERGLR